MQYFTCSSRDNSTQLAAKIKIQPMYQTYRLSLATESPDIIEKANDLVFKFLGSEDPAEGVKKKKSSAYISLANIIRKNVYLVIDALDGSARIAFLEYAKKHAVISWLGMPLENHFL